MVRTSAVAVCSHSTVIRRSPTTAADPAWPQARSSDVRARDAARTTAAPPDLVERRRRLPGRITAIVLLEVPVRRSDASGRCRRAGRRLPPRAPAPRRPPPPPIRRARTRSRPPPSAGSPGPAAACPPTRAVVGRGTSMVRTAGLTSEPGYSRLSRSWAESGRSTGAKRTWLPCRVISVSPALRALIRSRGDGEQVLHRLRQRRRSGRRSSSRTACEALLGRDLGDLAVGLEPQPLARHVVVRQVRVDRAARPSSPTLLGRRRRGTRRRPRRPAGRRGRSRRPRCGRTARRRAGCPRRGSRGPSSPRACRRRGRCAGRWSAAGRAPSRSAACSGG